MVSTTLGLAACHLINRECPGRIGASMPEGMSLISATGTSIAAPIPIILMGGPKQFFYKYSEQHFDKHSCTHAHTYKVYTHKHTETMLTVTERTVLLDRTED